MFFYNRHISKPITLLRELFKKKRQKSSLIFKLYIEIREQNSIMILGIVP